MNLRIVTHINYEGDLVGIQEIVADFCEVLVARGFANEILAGDSAIKSIVIVKENKELADGSVSLEEFWANEIADQVLSALPAKDDEQGEEEDGAGSN